MTLCAARKATHGAKNEFLSDPDKGETYFVDAAAHVTEAVSCGGPGILPLFGDVALLCNERLHSGEPLADCINTIVSQVTEG